MNQEELIKRRAHEIWESEGRPEGRNQEHWDNAVQEIEAEGSEASRGPAVTGPAVGDDSAPSVDGEGVKNSLSDKPPLGPAQPFDVSVPESTRAKEVRSDAAGHMVRRRDATTVVHNPDGLHSANPVALSENGDATQPVRKRQKRQP
jgi:hypothetical protein